MYLQMEQITNGERIERIATRRRFPYSNVIRGRHLCKSLWQRGRRYTPAVGVVFAFVLGSVVGSGQLAVASHGRGGTGQVVGASTIPQQATSPESVQSRRVSGQVVGASTIAQQATLNTPLGTFDATGLYASPATGSASRTVAPPGFALKHTHGGPGYVYVLSGSMEIVETGDTVTTYHTGEFFREFAGHVHTIRTPEGAEWFTLRFLPPEAIGTIPVQ